ncbi:2-pyrone-4,6-dicarboxylate hydrolase [Ktedonobacteria bacterium brp13]|nr:2-pyrone-4,6-dicarboxylate hydrolase [Ktedonobacteria bacterium brp13]
MEPSRYRIFDSHMHIIDPHFPLIPNQGYLPNYFTCEDYHARTAAFEVIGGAIVSGSFQGIDQTYLLESLKRLGPGFVGVTQFPATTPDEQILELNAAGVRAIRFNLRRGGPEALDQLEEMARRVFDLAGWHTELYVDARDLPELESCVLALPKVSIDHLGLSKEGFKTLLRLIEGGVYVKATGFGRVDFDVSEALHAIYARNPAALLFGTDLPSPRAPRPFLDTDVALVVETLGEQRGNQVLYENALSFYGVTA